MPLFPLRGDPWKLEIGSVQQEEWLSDKEVPPSGGSLEIGNAFSPLLPLSKDSGSPFGGIPGNWKCEISRVDSTVEIEFPLRGDPWKLEISSCVVPVVLASTFPLRGDPWKLETFRPFYPLLGQEIKFPLRGDPWKLET